MNLIVHLLHVEFFILNNKNLLKNIRHPKYNFLYVSKIEFNNFLKRALNHDFQVHYIHAIHRHTYHILFSNFDNNLVS
jgi:hypothetical protein